MPSSNKPIIRRASCYVANKDSGILSSLGLDYSVDRKVRGIPSNEVNKRILFKASNEYGEDEEYVRIIARDPVVPPVLSASPVVWERNINPPQYYPTVVLYPSAFSGYFPVETVMNYGNPAPYSYRGLRYDNTVKYIFRLAEGREGGTWSLSGDKRIRLISWSANATQILANPAYYLDVLCFLSSVSRTSCEVTFKAYQHSSGWRYNGIALEKNDTSYYSRNKFQTTVTYTDPFGNKASMQPDVWLFRKWQKVALKKAQQLFANGKDHICTSEIESF